MAPGKSAWVALWLTTTSAFCSMVCTREFQPCHCLQIRRESVTGTTSGFEATTVSCTGYLAPPGNASLHWLAGRSQRGAASGVSKRLRQGGSQSDCNSPRLPWSLPFTQKFGEVAAVNCGRGTIQCQRPRGKGKIEGRGGDVLQHFSLAPFWQKLPALVTSRKLDSRFGFDSIQFHHKKKAA